MRSYITISALVAWAAIALATSCDKGGAKGGDHAKLTNPLWAMAPANTAFGLVVADGTGTQLHKALTAIEKAVASRPGGKDIVARVRAEIREDIPVDPLDAESIASFGIDLARGAAVFVTADEKVTLILPVVKREAFVAAIKGTSENGIDSFPRDKGRCKEISGRYACAETAAELDLLGKSDEMTKRMASQTRGHIEVWADLAALGESDVAWREYFDGPGVVSGAVQIAPGGFTIRGRLAAKPTDSRVLALTDASIALAQAVAKDKPAGMFRFSMPIFGTLVPADEAARDLAPLAMIGGIDVTKDLIENVTGELVMYSPAGEGGTFIIKLGVRDGARLEPLVKGLCNLAGQQAPQFGIKLDGNRCVAELDLAKMAEQIPDARMLPFSGPVTLTVHSEASAVVVTARPAGSDKGGSVEYDDLARDLTSGSWSFAAWGRGVGVSPHAVKSLDEFKSLPKVHEIMTTIGWATAHLSEVGMGGAVRGDGAHFVLHVGTQFANPDDVLAEFQTIVTRIYAGDESAMADLEKLAKKSPDTVLGRSFAAGQGGLSGISGAVTGIVAAVAIPAFMKYVRRAQALEAELGEMNEAEPRQVEEAGGTAEQPGGSPDTESQDEPE